MCDCSVLVEMFLSPFQYSLPIFDLGVVICTSHGMNASFSGSIYALGALIEMLY